MVQLEVVIVKVQLSSNTLCWEVAGTWQRQLVVELAKDHLLKIGQRLIFDNHHPFGIGVDERDAIAVDKLDDVLIEEVHVRPKSP